MSQNGHITGGGGAIGRRLANAFASRGDNMATCDADPDAVAWGAEAVLCLVSPAARRNSGQNMAIDGHMGALVP